MNAFTFRDQIVQSDERFSRSFVRIAATDILKVIESEYERGRYWPEPPIQINPNDPQGSSVLELSQVGDCRRCRNSVRSISTTSP